MLHMQFERWALSKYLMVLYDNDIYYKHPCFCCLCIKSEYFLKVRLDMECFKMLKTAYVSKKVSVICAGFCTTYAVM